MLGPPAQLVPTSPARPPGLLGLVHHGACHPGQDSLAWRCQRGEEGAGGDGESSRGRRMSIVEAENGHWGHQPFGLVPRALEEPSQRLASAASRDGEVGVGFQGDIGSNPSARVKEDGSLAGESPFEQAGPWGKVRDSEPTLAWLGKGWTTTGQAPTLTTTSSLFLAVPACHLVPQLLGK